MIAAFIDLLLCPAHRHCGAAVGGAARNNFTDRDIVDFLVNVECLEGLFDTWGVYGTTFNNNLTLGGPTPIGARKANLSEEVALHLAEVALNEQVSCLLFLHPEPGCPACPCCPVKVRLRQHANKSVAELALNEQVSPPSFFSEPSCPACPCRWAVLFPPNLH